mmetsp:Transcript_1270/g.3640  ORF Transcript_1270/g.3640 Transcript_1270/m.3640 type:complete len:107 (+) Transcript_1270:693-1013(+)
MRVVMRREQTHSLVLNVKLGPQLVTPAKQADTAIRLACVTGPTTAATYLLRVKTKDDRDALFDHLARAQAPSAPSSSAGGDGKPASSSPPAKAAAAKKEDLAAAAA